MFNSVLGYAASTYEAIIAAFIVLGLLQTAVLWSKAKQGKGLKAAYLKLAKTGTLAICAGYAETSVWKRRAKQAENRADAVTESLFAAQDNINALSARAESAERELMELADDKDDAADDVRGTQTLVFGDSHVGDLRHGADFHGAELRSLFAMLDGSKSRNGAALDDLLFGRGNRSGRGFKTVQGGDFLDGPFTNNRAPGEPDRPLKMPTLGDLLDSLNSGTVGIDVTVIGLDGKAMPSGPEKDAIVRSCLGSDPSVHPLGDSRPSFDHLDPAAFGAQVHEAIERRLANGQDTLKASLSDDPGAHGTVEGMTGPDESCSTQDPHNYGGSSPRAG